MCGRFYIEEEDNEEILRIVRRLDERFKEKNTVKTGEIYPTNTVAVLSEYHGNVDETPMRWGFPGFKGSEVIINARSESAEQKQMFSDSLHSKRIIIPANGFYEWNRKGNKEKYYFTDNKEKVVYMAGLYEQYGDNNHFVILTTAANESMQEIHNRMPVLLEKQEIDSFLCSYNTATNILFRIPKLLDKKIMPKKNNTGYEQLSFDLNSL